MLTSDVENTKMRQHSFDILKAFFVRYSSEYKTTDSDVLFSEECRMKKAFSMSKECQARSHVCVAGVATLPWRNHVVQNLTAYFTLHVVTIKYIMCVQENIKLSSLSQRPRLS